MAAQAHRRKKTKKQWLTSESLYRTVTVDGWVSERTASTVINLGALGKVVAATSDVGPNAPLEPGASTAMEIEWA